MTTRKFWIVVDRLLAFSFLVAATVNIWVTKGSATHESAGYLAGFWALQTRADLLERSVLDPP